MRNFKLLVFIGIYWVIGLLGYFPSPVSAQGLGCGKGFGLIAEALCGQDAEGKQAGMTLNSVIGSIIGFLTIIAGLWFLIQIIIAGYDWMSAGGDKTKVEAAWGKIYRSLIGLGIVVAAAIIVGLFGSLLGLEILNPGAVIQNLTIQ